MCKRTSTSLLVLLELFIEGIELAESNLKLLDLGASSFNSFTTEKSGECEDKGEINRFYSFSHIKILNQSTANI